MQNNISSVCDFELNSYLGWWYEIARLDRSFEKNFVKLTDEFVLRKKNIVNVVNQELLNRDNEWNEDNSKAYIINIIHQFHNSGNRRVKLLAHAVVAANLLYSFMRFSTQISLYLCESFYYRLV